MVQLSPGNGQIDSLPTETLTGLMQEIAADRSRDAFVALFEVLAPKIKGFGLDSGCSEAQAESLTRRTMVALWARAADFPDAGCSLSSWVFRLIMDESTRGPGLSFEWPDHPR